MQSTGEREKKRECEKVIKKKKEKEEEKKKRRKSTRKIKNNKREKKGEGMMQSVVGQLNIYLRKSAHIYVHVRLPCVG